jgi:hypothetical protein
MTASVEVGQLAASLRLWAQCHGTRRFMRPLLAGCLLDVTPDSQWRLRDSKGAHETQPDGSVVVSCGTLDSCMPQLKASGRARHAEEGSDGPRE